MTENFFLEKKTHKKCKIKVSFFKYLLHEPNYVLGKHWLRSLPKKTHFASKS